MIEYCTQCPCRGCEFDVCGRGSETCSAVIGDYCQMIGNYILPTINEWQNYDEETKSFYLEFFSNLGIDIPYCM